MHSKIKAILNTSSILDGIPMPVQKLNALENKINAEYISYCGWNIPVQASNAFENQRNGKYIHHF
jgi:hypothetical protein